MQSDSVHARHCVEWFDGEEWMTGGLSMVLHIVWKAWEREAL